MRKFLLITLALTGAAAILAAGQASETTSAKAECLWSTSQDAVQAAPLNHRVVLENDKVRVLDVIVPPPGNMSTTTPTKRCCSTRGPLQQRRRFR